VHLSEVDWAKDYAIAPVWAYVKPPFRGAPIDLPNKFTLYNLGGAWAVWFHPIWLLWGYGSGYFIPLTDVLPTLRQLYGGNLLWLVAEFPYAVDLYPLPVNGSVLAPYINAPLSFNPLPEPQSGQPATHPIEGEEVISTAKVIEFSESEPKVEKEYMTPVWGIRKWVGEWLLPSEVTSAPSDMLTLHDIAVLEKSVALREWASAGFQFVKETIHVYLTERKVASLGACTGWEGDYGGWAWQPDGAKCFYIKLPYPPDCVVPPKMRLFYPLPVSLIELSFFTPFRDTFNEVVVEVPSYWAHLLDSILFTYTLTYTGTEETGYVREVTYYVGIKRLTYPVVGVAGTEYHGYLGEGAPFVCEHVYQTFNYTRAEISSLFLYGGFAKKEVRDAVRLGDFSVYPAFALDFTGFGTGVGRGWSTSPVRWSGYLFVLVKRQGDEVRSAAIRWVGITPKVWYSPPPPIVRFGLPLIVSVARPSGAKGPACGAELSSSSCLTIHGGLLVRREGEENIYTLGDVLKGVPLRDLHWLRIALGRFGESIYIYGGTQGYEKLTDGQNLYDLPEGVDREALRKPKLTFVRRWRFARLGGADFEDIDPEEFRPSALGRRDMITYKVGLGLPVRALDQLNLIENVDVEVAPALRGLKLWGKPIGNTLRGCVVAWLPQMLICAYTPQDIDAPFYIFRCDMPEGKITATEFLGAVQAGAILELPSGRVVSASG
jgi:hypothetical protein